MDKTFQKNVNLWAKTSPKALMLPYFDDSGIRSCQTSPLDALKEAEEWFASLDLRGIQVVYVYGVGLGYYYEAAKQWLKKGRERYLVFLEDDLGVIYKLFETDIATEILTDKKVQLHYFKDLDSNKDLFESIYWNFVQLSMKVTALKSYAMEKQAFISELKHKIEYETVMKNALVDEYLKHGIVYFRGYYPNLLQLPESQFGNSLFGKFINVPAIICGAGPSLGKNLDVLGTLKDKALIFAGGSAVNALNNAGIMPHLGAGIDPNADQFQRMSTNMAFETPYLYRNRVFHDAFRLIHGPRLYITGGGGYDVSEWFEEKLGIKAEFLDEGHNVVNFCTEIACAMGCNPIIYVGMDLGFTGMQYYAPGILEDALVKEEEITSKDDFDSKAILRHDVDGKPLFTLWKWIAESNWISDYAKEHPQSQFINSTEGGLGFPEVSNVPLAEVAEKLLVRHYDLNNRLHGEIQSSPLPGVTKEKVVAAIHEMQESITRCMEDFNVLLEETVAAEQKLKSNPSISEVPQSGRAALYETDLSEEIGYKHVIDVFNVIYTSVLKREIVRAKRGSKRTTTLKKLALNRKKFEFLRDTAVVHLEIIKMAFGE